MKQSMMTEGTSSKHVLHEVAGSTKYRSGISQILRNHNLRIFLGILICLALVQIWGHKDGPYSTPLCNTGLCLLKYCETVIHKFLSNRKLSKTCVKDSVDWNFEALASCCGGLSWPALSERGTRQIVF